MNNNDLNIKSDQKVQSKFSKIFIASCFVLGGLCAFASANIDLEALNDPNKKSFTEMLFNYEYTDIKNNY